jgi:hypothetical protein
MNLIKFLILTNFIFSLTSSMTQSEIEQSLKTRLLKDYDKNVRPITDKNYTTISLSLNLKTIISIDEKKEIMTSAVYITLAYEDPRLSWNITQEGGVSSLLIPVQSIWYPDFYVINSADATGFVRLDQLNTAFIYPYGAVYITIGLNSLNTRCSINTKNFPDDKQTCEIHFGSWQNAGARMRFTKEKAQIDLSEYKEHPVWSLDKNIISEERLTNGTRFAYNFYDYGYDVAFKFNFKRRPGLFIMNNIFPTLVLNSVSIFLYYVPYSNQLSMSKCVFSWI